MQKARETIPTTYGRWKTYQRESPDDSGEPFELYLRVGIVGAIESGKTCLAHRFIEGEFPDRNYRGSSWEVEIQSKMLNIDDVRFKVGKSNLPLRQLTITL